GCSSGCPMRDRQWAEITDKVSRAALLDRREAVWLWEHASDAELAGLATMARDLRHPRGTATYIKMAIVNYTNVCVAKCDYCAFYRLPHQPGTYLLDFDQVCEKVDALVAFGGTLVSFNGGFHPKLRL